MEVVLIAKRLFLKKIVKKIPKGKKRSKVNVAVNVIKIYDQLPREGDCE